MLIKLLNATDTDLDEAAAAVLVVATDDKKCDRCWQRRPEVGEIAGHEEICARCVANISDEAGESRRWV